MRQAVSAHGALISELELPPGALLALAERYPSDFPVLFDSAATGPLGHWSMLAAFPGERLSLYGDGRLATASASAPSGDDFLGTLAQRWRAASHPSPAQANEELQLPFRGGWVVYLGYEMAAQIEPGLVLPRQPGSSLLATALRVPAALLYDHVERRCYAMAEPDEPALLRELAARAHLVSGAAASSARSSAQMRVIEADPAQFEQAVRRAQEYIRAGDIYQVNLSRQWQVACDLPLIGGDLYGALRRANPAPFAAWAQFPELQILSSSPERLVRVAGGVVETRPIAGTRARHRDGTASSELAELLASPKERAEHVMLIDLERNDLGRVCRPGSVRVDEFMVTESYPHLHHIVSNVRGELRDDTNPVAVLRALFPGGTITGCPKYRCMQIIGELEGVARGPYTGSLGYINRDGSMDFNILIRSLSQAGTRLEFRTGAGIVADSDWQLELAETRAKAQGLLRAVGAQP